ncbi:metallophosphoesterase family protein [Phenylobacterium sp.]|uniref:metallophosphoesterase family protein n=1 Tax=Phenylobacterium sp. TaxID=1871053 RepID=UPI0035AE7EB8
MSRGATEGELVYAIGDVHGCYEAMKALLARIAADSAEHARGRRPILVFLGDYVDRGPDSARVLEALLWLRRRPDLEVRLLKGNHEQAMLAFLERPQDGGGWLRFGGVETLAAYGVAAPSDPAGYGPARDELLERMPASHLWLLQRLELMLAVGDYAFVHAGVRPGAALAAQTEDDLLWIRQAFLEAPGPHEKVIVHGHTWLDERPQLHDHRIGVDTGVYATGVLTAVRLDGDERAVLQANTPAAAPVTA